MKVRNASTTPIRVAGTHLLPGQGADIPENHWQGWLAESARNQELAVKFLLQPPPVSGPAAAGEKEAAPPPPPPPETKAPAGDTKPPAAATKPPPPETKPAPAETPPPADIDPAKVDAALAAFDHDDNALWTEAGLPQVPALQKATGYKQLRARHRDAAVERTGITRKQ